MSQTLVDVVIPTMGRVELSRALESVRNQTALISRIFVVLDDPAAEARVAALLASGDRERLILTSGRVGGGAARQKGVEASSADWVAFLDDDDWWEPQKTELQLERLLREAAHWSVAKTVFHRSDGSVVEVPRRDPSMAPHLPSYVVERSSLRYGSTFMQSSSLMVERSTAHHVPWDGALRRHQDWDIMIRLAAAGYRLSYVDQPVVHVVQGSAASVSRGGDWRSSAEWYASVKRELRPRSAADFVASVVLRNAVKQRDGEGVRWSIGELTRLSRPPHLAAIAVAAQSLVR